jgi:hypothetical protein
MSLAAPQIQTYLRLPLFGSGHLDSSSHAAQPAHPDTRSAGGAGNERPGAGHPAERDRPGADTLLFPGDVEKRGIWAPEMHEYRGKYYLFLTFDTNTLFPEPLFADGGGHSMLFHRFDGQLMMVLHQPNDGGRERARLFEIEDTGETLRISRDFPA